MESPKIFTPLINHYYWRNRFTIIFIKLLSLLFSSLLGWFTCQEIVLSKTNFYFIIFMDNTGLARFRSTLIHRWTLVWIPTREATIWLTFQTKLVIEVFETGIMRTHICFNKWHCIWRDETEVTHHKISKTRSHIPKMMSRKRMQTVKRRQKMRIASKLVDKWNFCKLVHSLNLKKKKWVSS